MSEAAETEYKTFQNTAFVQVATEVRLPPTEAYSPFAMSITLGTCARFAANWRELGAQVTTYQMLANPIYSGRIKHHKAVYEGQHAALVEPADWNAQRDAIKSP